jgi:hypothetical protein
MYKYYLLQCSEEICAVRSDLDAVTVRTYLYWNYSATNVATTLKDLTLPRLRKGPISEHVHIYKGTTILVRDLEETEAMNDCAGGGQEQLNQPILI